MQEYARKNLHIHTFYVILSVEEEQKMTVPLSTRIDPKVKKILNELHKRTRIPIRILTEKAIFLLKERYDRLSRIHEQGIADEGFMELLDHSLRSHDATYRKLAE